MASRKYMYWTIEIIPTDRTVGKNNNICWPHLNIGVGLFNSLITIKKYSKMSYASYWSYRSEA